MVAELVGLSLLHHGQGRLVLWWQLRGEHASYWHRCSGHHGRSFSCDEVHGLIAGIGHMCNELGWWRWRRWRYQRLPHLTRQWRDHRHGLHRGLLPDAAVTAECLSANLGADSANGCCHDARSASGRRRQEIGEEQQRRGWGATTIRKWCYSWRSRWRRSEEHICCLRLPTEIPTSGQQAAARSRGRGCSVVVDSNRRPQSSILRFQEKDLWSKVRGNSLRRRHHRHRPQG